MEVSVGVDNLERRQSLSENQELAALDEISDRVFVGQIQCCSLYHPWFQHPGACIQDESLCMLLPCLHVAFPD